jgi:hypothetical protein
MEGPPGPKISPMKRRLATLLLFAPALLAQDHATLTLDQVEWTTEDKPNMEHRLMPRELRGWPQPEVRITGAEEAWLGLPYAEFARRDVALRLGDVEVSRKGGGTDGELWLRGPSGDLERYPFRFVLEQADHSEGAFLENRYLAYAWRHALDLPGAAWFRHEKEATARALEDLGLTVPAFGDNLRDVRGHRNDVDRTFDLFTGGRALAENLALDDAIEVSDGDHGPTVALSTLAGITVPEIDWAPLLEGQDPLLDPLAARLPADQHAVFFPSFASLVEVLDELRKNGAPVLELLDHSSEDARTQERYEAQLALPLDAATRLLGGALVTRVAVTGGDPYFRTGTDVAVLFETSNASALLKTIVARQQEAATAHADVQVVSGAVEGLSYQGVRTPDRSLCSYVAQVGGEVVVTNSLAQLARLAEVELGEAPALADLDEYRWFRSRYARGDREDALAIVTDATIRRWASPHWRIAASRRTRAAAWMAEGTAANVAAALDQGRLPEPGGARSATYGSPDFLTPIGELELEFVTEEEAEGYARFRTRYTNMWREVFDPAALRLVVDGDTLEVDFSIRPLAVRSDYREWIAMTRGATLAPTAGDPHPGTALHFAMAFGRESSMYRSFNNFLTSGVFKELANPLAWLGDDVSVWLEDDPAFWKEVAASDDMEEFLEDNLYRLPVAAHIPSTNPLRLAAFLTGVRSFIEGAAPGLVQFTTREHAERGYVAILPEDIEDFLGQPLAIYYVSLPDAWVLSLREDVIHRTIERFQAKEQAPVEKTWLGESAAIRLGDGFKPMLAAMWGDPWRSERQRLAWRAQPILDEWRRLAPEVDPVDFHRAHFGVSLRGPDGGRYLWDEDWGRTTCSVYGHPGAPGVGPLLPPAIDALRGFEAGLTFEDGDGLRARARLER